MCVCEENAVEKAQASPYLETSQLGDPFHRFPVSDAVVMQAWGGGGWKGKEAGGVRGREGECVGGKRSGWVGIS